MGLSQVCMNCPKIGADIIMVVHDSSVEGLKYGGDFVGSRLRFADSFFLLYQSRRRRRGGKRCLSRSLLICVKLLSSVLHRLPACDPACG